MSITNFITSVVPLSFLLTTNPPPPSESWCWAGCDGGINWHVVWYESPGPWDCASAGGCHWSHLWLGKTCVEHHEPCFWVREFLEEAEEAINAEDGRWLRLVVAQNRQNARLDIVTQRLIVLGCNGEGFAHLDLSNEMVGVLQDLMLETEETPAAPS